MTAPPGSDGDPAGSGVLPRAAMRGNPGEPGRAAAVRASHAARGVLCSGRMVRARPALVVVVVVGAVLLGCARLANSREGWQRTSAWMMQPAPIQPPRGAQRPAEVRTFRLRAYADEDYQAHAQDWELRIRDQVRRANELLEVQFGLRFEVEVRRWDRPGRGGALVDALRQLRSAQRGDADWIVGFVGPVPEDSWQDHLGVATAFRPELVLRAMMSPADLMRLEIGYDRLTPAEREALANARRLHRETVVFLHEWAHTVGAVHECDNKWIMSETYGVVASGFSPESERLVRLTLEHGRAGGAAARVAFRDAWRAEVARMQSAAWECSVLEKGLAEQDALLGKAISDSEARPATSP